MKANHDKIKQAIEIDLLVAMKALDEATFKIYQCTDEEFRDKYYYEANKLGNAKNEIKHILNQHFDRLARTKTTLSFTEKF